MLHSFGRHGGFGAQAVHPVVHVGQGIANRTDNGLLPINYAVGATEGDLAVLYTYNNGSEAPPSTAGWTPLGSPSGLGGGVYGKLLTTADFSATVTGGGAGVTAVVDVIRNCSSAVLLGSRGISSNDDTSSTVFTGFAPTVEARALLFLLGRTATSSTLSLVSPSMPSGLYIPNSGVWSAPALFGRSLLVDPPSEYPSNAAVHFSYGTGFSQVSLTAVELR